MNAQLLAIDAARKRGARINEPPAQVIQPALPPEPVPARIEAETLAAFGQVIMEAVAAQKAEPLDLGPLEQQLRQLFEKSDPAVDPALLAALGALGAALADQAQRVDAQLVKILRAIAGLASGQRDIIATLNAPVMAQYDDEGRVISAQRAPA